MNKKEEKERESGSLSDNNFSQVQKIIKDNNLPTFYSTEEEDEEDDDTETEE